MNALHQLSQQYAQDKYSFDEYRSKRKTLINDILKGGYVEQTSITNVPYVETDDSTLPIEPAKESPATTRTVKPKPTNSKKGTTYLILIILVVSATGAAFWFKEDLLKLTSNYFPTVNSHVESTNTQPSQTFKQLQTLWRSTVNSGFYPISSENEFKGIWLSASKEDKQQFIDFLNTQIATWDDDFNKELEVSLTRQVLLSLNAQPEH